MFSDLQLDQGSPGQPFLAVNPRAFENEVELILVGAAYLPKPRHISLHARAHTHTHQTTKQEAWRTDGWAGVGDVPYSLMLWTHDTLE